MDEIKILNAWGREANEFRNLSTANNGGGYRQPYGGLTVQVGDEHLYIEVEDSGCGDFGKRYSIAVYAIERQMKWFICFNQMDEQKECEKILRRWEKDKRSITSVMKITLENVEKLIAAAWDAASIYADEEYWRKKSTLSYGKKGKRKKLGKCGKAQNIKQKWKNFLGNFKKVL